MGLRSPLLLWAPVIYVASSLSSADIRRLNVLGIPSEAIHRLGHLVEYATLAALFIRALRHTEAPPAPRRKFRIAAIALIVFAGADEWHQTLVPGRHGRASDVLYDILCIAIGVAVYCWYDRRRSELAA